MKMRWEQAVRGGGWQLREAGGYPSWWAWVEVTSVQQLRGRNRGSHICRRWTVWIAEGGGEVDVSARFKSLKKAKRYAEATVRVTQC